MFARINNLTGSMQNFNQGLEGLESLKSTIYAAMQQQKGFQHLYFMADAATNKGYLVTIWDSEADLQAWLKSDAMQQASAQLLASNPNWPPPPPFEDYEVLFGA